MGLHQEASIERPDQSVGDRHLTFWTLYILDKANLLCTGQPCFLPSYDCGAPFPAPNSAGDMSHVIFMGRIKLANIQEEIYQRLYTVEGSRKGSLTRLEHVDQLTVCLEDWRLQFSSILQLGRTSNESLTTPARSVDLSYAYLTSCILVQRCNTQSDEMRTRLLDYCRRALSLITEKTLSTSSFVTTK